MIDVKQINQWFQDMVEALPPGMKNLPKDMEEHLRAAMQTTFMKLDLVTREEFDVQVKVLQKTRSKLEQLEEKIRELEGKENK